MYGKIQILLFILLAIGGDLHAQSNEGREFWLSFMHHRDENINSKVIMITSKYNTSGTVSMPLRGFEKSFSVTANEVTIIALPNYAEAILSESVLDIGIKVTSAHPISVYIHQYYQYRSEAALVLPIESLGREYFVMSYAGVLNSNISYPSEFLAAAVYDDTTIRITPTVETKKGKKPGIPFTVTLQKGEVYQVEDKNHIGDVTGSHVTGDKPFALFAGCRWTEVPTGCGHRDNLLEQMYAVETWGRKFVGIPAVNVNHSLFRILASEDATTAVVHFPDKTTTFQIDRGEFVEFYSGSPFYLESDKPIYPAQYLIGTTCSGYGLGDPSMLLLNSIEQTRDTVTLYNSALENIVENFINIIMYASDVANITLDGQKIEEKAVVRYAGPNEEFAYATVRVSSGAHTIVSSGCGVIASAYGYGNAESYAYSGGASFRPINFNTLPEGGCLNDTIFFDSRLSPGRYEFFWDLGDGHTSTEASFTHKYPDLGTYPLVVIVKDLCLSKSDTFYRDIRITLRQAVEVSEDVTLCQGEQAEFTASDIQEATYLWEGPNAFVSESQSILFDPAETHQSGTYEVIGIVSGCATHPATIELKVHPLPKPNIGQDTMLCPNKEEIVLNGGVFSTYLWSTGDQTSTIWTAEAGTYYLTVSDENDCSATTSIHIAEVCPTRIYIPNIFSPNGDGVNDYFEITANDLKSFDLEIFDRWGNKVVRLTDQTEGWDGKANGRPVPVGVYTYIIRVLGTNQSGADQEFVSVGDVTLVR